MKNIKAILTLIIAEKGKPNLEQIEILRKISKDGTSNKWNKISELWKDVLKEPPPTAPDETTNKLNKENAKKILKHFNIGPGYIK